MHYIGMLAFRLAALWLAFCLRGETTPWTWRKAISAVVMGAAIPIMHYTGMAAAHFMPSPTTQGSMAYAVEVSSLSVVGITTVTLMVLGLVVLTALADRRFALQALELEASRRHHRIIKTALDAFIAMEAEVLGRGLSEMVIPLHTATRPATSASCLGACAS